MTTSAQDPQNKKTALEQTMIRTAYEQEQLNLLAKKFEKEIAQDIKKMDQELMPKIQQRLAASAKALVTKEMVQSITNYLDFLPLPQTPEPKAAPPKVAAEPQIFKLKKRPARKRFLIKPPAQPQPATPQPALQENTPKVTPPATAKAPVVTQPQPPVTAQPATPPVPKPQPASSPAPKPQPKPQPQNSKANLAKLDQEVDDLF